MRNNYNCSNINRIKSPKALWIYKHPIFFGKVKHSINRKNIYMRVQKNRKKDNTKKISYAYTITISHRNYEVMNLGVETETKKILNGKKKKK